MLKLVNTSNKTKYIQSNEMVKVGTNYAYHIACIEAGGMDDRHISRMANKTI